MYQPAAAAEARLKQRAQQEERGASSSTGSSAAVQASATGGAAVDERQRLLGEQREYEREVLRTALQQQEGALVKRMWQTLEWTRIDGWTGRERWEAVRLVYKSTEVFNTDAIVAKYM
jgi:hypothetical protein